MEICRRKVRLCTCGSKVDNWQLQNQRCMVKPSTLTRNFHIQPTKYVSWRGKQRKPLAIGSAWSPWYSPYIPHYLAAKTPFITNDHSLLLLPCILPGAPLKNFCVRHAVTRQTGEYKNREIDKTANKERRQCHQKAMAPPKCHVFAKQLYHR